MLPSAKPYGPLIVPGTTIKLRGAVLLQDVGQWPYWSQFWRDWDWTKIKLVINNLATVGVNCIQVTATGLDDGGVTHPGDAEMMIKVTQLATYCASKGMCLNPQFGYQPVHTFANGATVATAAAVRMARIFAAQPNIAFYDAMNEVNYTNGPGWGGPNAQAMADCTQFNAGIRAVIGPVPMTFSVGCSTKATYSGAWMELISPLSDFHNIHTYTYNEAGSGPAPLMSDLANMRAAPWYKGRFIVGETGVPLGNGASAQTAWLTGNGVMATHPECLGSILWGATDTTGPGVTPGFGMMDSTGTSLRTQISAPVSNWPAVI